MGRVRSRQVIPALAMVIALGAPATSAAQLAGVGTGSVVCIARVDCENKRVVFGIERTEH